MASDVLLAADGHWPRLLTELAGLTPEQLQDRHQPCPACGGTDRYRWDRDDGPGGWYCNQCGGRERSGGGGSGMDLLLRVTGWDFATAARHLEAHLSLEQPKPLRVALPPPVASQRAEPDVSWDGLLASAAPTPPPLQKRCRHSTWRCSMSRQRRCPPAVPTPTPTTSASAALIDPAARSSTPTTAPSRAGSAAPGQTLGPCTSGLRCCRLAATGCLSWKGRSALTC